MVDVHVLLSPPAPRLQPQRMEAVFRKITCELPARTS